jgi:hypothetical protein
MLDDILYSPMPGRWEHLWSDLDKQNVRSVKLLLKNLETRVEAAHELRRHNPDLAPIPPDQKLVDATAEITAYVFPRLIANHVVGVQPLAAEKAMIAVLGYKQAENGINLEITNQVLQACTKHLCMRIDLDAKTEEPFLEYLDEIKRDLIAELDYDLLRSLRHLPPDPRDTFKVPFDISTEVAHAECDMLACMIRRETAYVAHRTRRGRANFAVVSPVVLSLLDLTTGNQWKRDPEHALWETSVYPSFVEYVGILEPGIKIFCDPYADDNTPIVTGYRGESAVDAGYYWSPYVLANPMSLQVDPNTFESFYSFKTMHGHHCLNCTEKAGIKGHDYYGLIGIDAPTWDAGGLL